MNQQTETENLQFKLKKKKERKIKLIYEQYFIKGLIFSQVIYSHNLTNFTLIEVFWGS